MTGILIDVTRLVHRFRSGRLPTGVDRVSLAYIRHYGLNARAVLRYRGGKFVFRHAESSTLFDWLLALGTTGSPLPTIYKGLVTGCLAQGVAGSFLFNTGHSGLESDGYAAMLRQQKVRPIFVVHDLIPITHPEFCRAGEQEKHLARLRNAVQVASGIVCNSQATRDALEALCTRLDWRLPPTTVAQLAPELPAASAAGRPMAHPYFVFVSTLEPRKNHLMILRVWQQLALEMGEAAPRLVLIGQRGWDFDEIASLLKRSDVLKRLVSEVGACSDAQLVAYLQHAQALLFPSFTEGFGMPVVEALAHGVPVIASDLQVFREFAGNIPEYLSVNEPGLVEAQWAEVINNYTKPGSPRRAVQLARMAGYLAPSWKGHFDRVDALLAGLFETPQTGRPRA
jgi:glycosyltransferase involved in cell wall biosynthesis